MRISTSRVNLRHPLAAGVLLSLCAVGAAHAQSATDPPPLVAPPEQDTEEATAKTLDRIQVTGTRIPPRAGFDTLEPAAVVSRDYIQDLGITNVAEAVFQQPSMSAGASYRGGQASFGAGVNFASRFGLGSNRLLTLVNGRRFVSSNPPTVFGPAGAGTQVDLNAIPTNLIERVESVGIGGAPTYGSDAISGVNNLLLRKNFEGVETTIGYGVTERGDNDRYTISSLFGSNFADGRGNIMVSLGYDQNDGVLAMERAFYRDSYSLQPNPNAALIARFQPGRDYRTDGRVNPDIPFNTSGTDGIPGQVYIRDRRIMNMTWGGLLFPSTGPYNRDASGQLRGFGPNQDQFYHFDNHGKLVRFDPGTNFGISSASGGDGINLNETVQVISDLDRKTAYSLGSFDINEHVRAIWELSWFGSEARELIDQNTYNAASFGGLSAPLTFSIDNPFLDSQARATLAGMGVNTFRLSRSSRDLSTNNASSNTRIRRGVAGLNGYFDIGRRGFNWEASLTRGEGDFAYHGTGLIQQNFINAINARRDAAGNIVCDATRPGTVADPNCVPLNLFGEGVASPEALAYVITPTRATAQMRQTVMNANITGGLFDLPGGEFQFNTGFEYRKEEGAFTPSDYQRLGLGRAVPIEGADGSYSTRELFAELLAPLVDGDAGLPGLHRLDLTAKVRRVDNSVNGMFTAYTYGLQYEPWAGLQLRGNKTRSFRAPAITELYTSRQPAFFGIPEPCQASNIDSGPRPELRRRNCEAFFAAYPHVDRNSFQAPGATVLGYLTGSRELQNEQADSWTAGVVFKPEWAPGLRLAGDWYEIDLTNAITSLSAADIASGCFDNAEFNTADVNNANRFCSLITRDPATAVASSITTTFGNGPHTNFRGWSAEVGYQWDMARFGMLDLSFYGYFPKTYDEQAAPGVPEVSRVGEIGYEKRQFQWIARHRVNDWRFSLAANYRSAALVSNTNTVETRDFLRKDSVTTFDASVGYHWNKQVRFNLAVLNATDEFGPFPFVDDALGRRYMFTTTVKY